MAERRGIVRWVGLGAIATIVGCGGSGESSSSTTNEPPSRPAYYEDVAAIFDAHCVSCHSAGNIAPFSLETYDDAKPKAALVAQETAAKRMPPWHVDDSGACNTYRDARTLTDAEIATLAKWASTGAPAGDPAHAPPAPKPPPSLDQPDAILDPGLDYMPDASRTDDYRCFLVDPGFTVDRFLVGYEVRPTMRSEVHHAVVYAIDDSAAELSATQLDAAAPGPGYTCFGGPGVNARPVVAWAPGTGVTRYPDGTGLRLTAGHKLVLQVHYNLAAGAAPDRTTVALALADSVPKEATIAAVGDFDLNLPPGTAHVDQTATIAFPASPLVAYVRGVYPHMHKYGRTLRVDVEQAGQSTCLVDVPDWSFSWQQFYFYEQPIAIQPGGGTVTIKCSYDTTGADSVIHFGEGTGDEMCIDALYVTF